MLVAVEGNEPATIQSRNARNMKAMHRVEKKQRPDAFIQVPAFATETVERGGLGDQLFQRSATANPVKRLIADHRIRGGDDLRELRTHFAVLMARSSRSEEHTSELQSRFG